MLSESSGNILSLWLVLPDGTLLGCASLIQHVIVKGLINKAVRTTWLCSVSCFDTSNQNSKNTSVQNKQSCCGWFRLNHSEGGVKCPISWSCVWSDVGEDFHGMMWLHYITDSNRLINSFLDSSNDSPHISYSPPAFLLSHFVISLLIIRVRKKQVSKFIVTAFHDSTSDRHQHNVFYFAFFSSLRKIPFFSRTNIDYWLIFILMNPNSRWHRPTSHFLLLYEDN